MQLTLLAALLTAAYGVTALPQTTAPPRGLAGLQFWWRDSAATAACEGTSDIEFFPANQDCNIVPGAGQPGLGGYYAANLTHLTQTCSSK